MTPLKPVARHIARRVLDDYQLNRVYRLDQPLTPPALPATRRFVVLAEADLAELNADPDPELRTSTSFAGPGLNGFGIREGSVLAAVAFFADRDVFYDDGVWPLKRGEAALVELVTAEEHCGKGLAPLLIMHALCEMFQRSITRLYSWLWWTNRSLQSAFRKAGRKYTAFLMEIYPWRSNKLKVLRWLVERPSDYPPSEFLRS